MRPLEGIRVLDFTWVLSGPFATRLLADYGAEVIKIQSLATSKTPEANNDPYTCTWNRSKRSITLDMSRPEAKELFFELVKISDVVIDNFSPHVMERWGINYESLKKVNPRIIQAQISAAGHSGEDRHIAAFGPGIQAMTGLTAATSYDADDPLGIGFAYADHVMALYASAEILNALYNREETGEGAYIDISGIEAASSVYDTKRSGHAFVRQCEDGKWCAVSPETDADALYCEVAGAGMTAAELAEALQSELIPAYEVLGGQDLLKDLQLNSRGMFEDLPHLKLGKMLFDRTPIKTLPDEPCSAFESPQLGEANEYVFRQLLNMDAETYEKYVKDGVIA